MTLSFKEEQFNCNSRVFLRYSPRNYLCYNLFLICGGFIVLPLICVADRAREGRPQRPGHSTLRAPGRGWRWRRKPGEDQLPSELLYSFQVKAPLTWYQPFKNSQLILTYHLKYYYSFVSNFQLWINDKTSENKRIPLIFGEILWNSWMT